MSIVYLRNILKESEQVVENSGNWSKVEQELGIELPVDYERFIKTFGSVYIDEFIVILNPFSSNPNLDLTARGKVILEAYGSFENEESKYPYFPEKGGLLPFGMTDNGDVLFWKTEGKPHEWTIVVNASREALYDEFDENITSFLTRILKRELVCAIFPQDFPSESPEIVPIKL